MSAVDRHVHRPGIDGPRYVKPVRDGIAAFIGSGCHVRYHQAPPDEASRGLRRKLVEESVEYLEDPIVEELADVLEAVRALANSDHDLTLEELVAVADEKRRTRGGYDAGVALYIYTDEELAERERCVCDHPGSPPAAPDCPTHAAYAR